MKKTVKNSYYKRAYAIVLLLLTTVITTPVWAATITVSTVEDVNALVCTLRDAITAANTDFATGGCAAGDAVGQDTIQFAVTGTINLVTQLPDLLSNITISGPGSAVLTISGLGVFTSVLNVSGTGVIISGLTLTGGDGGFGGGLRVTATNQAQASDLVITANTAVDGGGIANEGTLALTDSSVTNNTSSLATYGGGGIYNSGNLTLDTVTISNNDDTNGNGGGIYNRTGGTMSLTDVTLTNNTVNGGNGAGIYNEGTIASFTGNTIGSNTGAGFGGGIYSNGNVTVNQSTITLHSVSSTGGGIYSLGNVTVTDSSVTSNTATSFGGGINAAAITLTRSLVSGNSSGTAGGGLYATTITGTNSTVSTNMSDQGGALYQGGASSTTFTNSTITGNSATTIGGGIWSTGTITLANSILANNTATNCYSPPGFGVYNSLGFNIDSANTCGLNAAGDDQINTDPMLAILQDNGGFTLTHALLTGSPAIDAADNANCPTTDQRGYTRPADGDGDMTATCDVGAYEFGATNPGGGGGTDPTGDFGTGGCFIATAAYGTAMADDVRYLRAFRDQYLLQNQWGKKFVNFYYDVSPSMADKLREHDSLRSIVRGLLKPLVWLSKNIVDEDVYRQQTEDQP